MSLTPKAWEFCDSIPGSFTHLNAEMLYQYALEAPKRIVEIGVDQGRSASLLLRTAEITGAEVILIDSWESVLIDNKAKVENLLKHFPHAGARIIYARSSEAAGRVTLPIDLIHIDANHYGEHPAQDCELWLPKLVTGGVACFHDYQSTFPAVTEAVDQYTKDWVDLGVWDSLAIRRKP